MHSKATFFEFTSYKFEPNKKRVVFNYKTEFLGKKPLFFTETIILPKVPNLKETPKELIKKSLESLHIILGISYYKLYCATEIRLQYEISKDESDFWNTVYKKGLGEFFYKNNLNPIISPKFPYKKPLNPKAITYMNNNFSYNYATRSEYKNKFLNSSLPSNYKLKARSLVGVGGGKDSIVASELLRNNGFNTTSFSVQTNKDSELINKIVQKIGGNELKIKRYLDWQIHQSHQYSGHIPISAIYAFLGVFSSLLYGYSDFIVSNEYSSNFGSLRYKGMEINHQWSKSFDFEKLFQDYVKNFLTPNVSYFSLLRPFYEIRIVKLFSTYKRYFPHFSSCNQNFTMQRQTSGGLWCGKCPKCVFVFTMLSAYLSKKELLNIFKKNLYEDKELLPLFKDVLGFGMMKPFDCVGTFEEAQSALYLAKKKFKNDFIMRQVSGKTRYYKEVFKTQKESAIPEQFRLLGVESALILRYGKEGKVVKEYLKKYYPKIKISGSTEEQGKDFLKKQGDFDIVIKTPGINKNLIKIPYTTPTNVFFSKVIGKNLIIGITGSKGKSTTSSLIYYILRTAGKNVELLGNIGKPMLERLLRPVNKGTIFVLELSSFQLDDIAFSPNIAVVTNLFPEHMDFHGGKEKYYQAKKNIINFQDANDYFVYNPKNNITKRWLKEYRWNAVPFLKNNFATSLVGEHNQDNIRAAVAVAQIIGIKDSIIKKVVKSFKSLPHRLEFVGEFKGIKFYDDAISTTPESTIMAIASLKDVDTIFLGGQDRGYNFSQLEKVIKKYHIRNIVLFPDSGKKMITSKKGFNIKHTSSMEDAVQFAYKNTKKGSVCLLSCASPSYSLWKNFNEKGDQFEKFVNSFSRGKIK